MFLLYVLFCGVLINFGESARPFCNRPAASGETLVITEDTAVSVTLYKFQGVDRDGDILVGVSEDPIPPFDIEGINLYIAQSLDFETDRQYNFNNLWITERGKYYLQFGDKCGPLTINVLPVNEFTPVFEPLFRVVTLKEGLQGIYSVDSLLSNFTCTDEDKEPIGAQDGCSQVLIESGDDADAKFTIVGDSIVTTNYVIDYDTGDTTYTLIIVGIDSSTRDSRRTGTMTVEVNIEPVNEFVPTIQNRPIYISIPEDTLVGTNISVVTAVDDDAGPHGHVTYKLLGKDDTFLISQTTGRIYLKRPVDFESTQKSYYVTVEASDGGLSSTAVVNVTVTDVNDNVPVCTQTENNVTVNEDMPVGSSIVSLSCTDNDPGTVLTYQILSGDNGDFQITLQGDINVADVLDYDQGLTSYYMSIEVSDGIHITMVWVLVQLAPVNEFSPIAPSYTVNVSEIAPIGSNVITYIADDRDAPPHAVMSYQIINVPNGEPNTFYIDKNTGKISLTEFLDFETIQQYIIVVKVTDSSGNFGTGTVVVNVDNENDHAPFCVQSTGIFSVSENAAVGDIVIPDFECTDLDNNLLSYSLIQSPDESAFDIDAQNRLKVKGRLDFETTSFYSIVIDVTDGSLSNTMRFTINVIDENESVPKFLNGVVISTIRESDRTGTHVAVVSATDEENNPLTYSFVGSYPEFMIDQRTGIIRLRTQVDREEAPTIDILVMASDGQFTSTATVLVTIEDVNEMPLFKNPKYEFSIEENKLAGTTVGIVSAEDPDIGDTNGKIQYSIVKGNENLQFDIEANTGIITLNAQLDYESQRSALLLIEASDLGSPSLSSVCTVIVHVLDQNDNAPSFLSLKQKERISEDTQVRQTVTRVYAYDKDSSVDDNNMVVYKSTSNIPFTVDSLTGVVKVSNNLDREKTKRYEMLITAADNGSPQLTGTLTLEIDITDVNDNDPIVRGTYIATVPENVPLHYVVFSIDASDADGEAFGTLRYEIVSPEMNSVFKIEENTGTVQTASELNRESQDFYEVPIKVSDNGNPPRSTTVTATVHVSDVNDVAPKPSHFSFEFSIGENAELDTQVGTISVLDDDLGINSKLAFSISTYWRGSETHFKVNQDDGSIFTTGTLDRELERKYIFSLRIEDGGTPSLSSDVTVNIIITDVNDNAPVFNRPFYSTTIFENQTTGINFLSAGASDDDLGINAVIAYELDTTSEEALRSNLYFGVHSQTGNIFLRRKVDREVYPYFTLTIIARDSGVPSLSSEVKVNIQIEDVNDNPPVFSPLFYNTEASSINLCDPVITTVRATDADIGRNAAINYHINENDASLPVFVSQLGVVTVKSDMLLSKYIIKINGRDNGDPFLFSKDPATVRIDRFDPDLSVIVFHLDMTLTDYFQKELDFLNRIEKALSKFYPNAYVRKWCIQEKDTYIVVYVYAVKNNETNDVKYLNIEKVFVTNGEFLPVLQLDQNNRPTVDIDGKKWGDFSVIKVVQYGSDLVYPDPTVSRLSDSTDVTDVLALPLGLSLPLLALLAITTIILIYCAWRRRWCKRNKGFFLKKTNRQTTKEHSLMSKKDSHKKTDQNADQNNQMNEMDENFSENSFTHVTTKQVSGPYIPTSSYNRPENIWKTESFSDHRKSQQLTETLTPKLNSNTGVEDGRKMRRGYDIGWVYEEDPDTRDRKWIRSPTDGSRPSEDNGI